MPGPCMARPAMLVVGALGFGNLPSALGQSMEPMSYTNAPIGLNFLIVGTTHQWGSVLVDPTSPVKDVDAKVDTATLAYMRVFDFWGQSGSLAVVVPNAWLSASGEVFDQARLGELCQDGAVSGQEVIQYRDLVPLLKQERRQVGAEADRHAPADPVALGGESRSGESGGDAGGGHGGRNGADHTLTLESHTFLPGHDEEWAGRALPNARSTEKRLDRPWTSLILRAA